MPDTIAPTPEQIFARAVEEGNRRLDQSLLELVATSFIAGFTVVFGIIALGIVEAFLAPVNDSVASLAGALAFGVGVVFLVVGRAELFNENFFDPAAAVVAGSESRPLSALFRLWSVTLVFNLLGGGLFARVFVVDGVLPPGTATALRRGAIESMHGSPLSWFAGAIAGGALVALLSFLLLGVDRVGSRIPLAYIVGVLLALGPFDHVVVTALHGLIGLWFGAPGSVATFVTLLVVVTVGNFVGGLGLVTLTHVVQAAGAE